MKNILILCTIFTTVCLNWIGYNCWASQKSRRIEEEKRISLEATELKITEGRERLLFDYGGWINFRYADYDNDDNDSSSPDTFDYSNEIDFRIWLKVILRTDPDTSYENEHFLYLRLKDLYIHRYPDDSAGGYDHDGPHLDYAYLKLDFRPWWMKIGRRYFSVGRGISYSDVNDGVELFFSSHPWSVKTFVSHTLPRENNIDMSVPGYSKESDRFYYGLESAYSGIPNHNLYGYFLVQRDYGNECPQDLSHDYSYNSEYIGLGAQGKILPKLNYWLEIIREMGESIVFNTNEKKDISAGAAVFGITYSWMVYSHPNLSFEYAFGSGDPDRISVTDTKNGNSSGDDKNFLYFGYIPTGYALAPMLSNLRLYRLGLSFKPLERTRFFENCELKFDYYLYRKDKTNGGIYDLDATEKNNDVGNEFDVTISWQILSDLSFALQYGHFSPGDAYSAATDDSEDYFSISVITTF